jgi:sugar lactone lactonase YvrE
MKCQPDKLFRAPCSVPNALEVTDDGLWIADQITDRLALIEIDEPSEYGVTMWRREIDSQCSNTSGMAFGDGSIWLAANGAATIWRPERPEDAQTGEILRVDPTDGSTLGRWPVPGGGGVHGIEYDHFEKGFVWVTTLSQQTLSKMRIDDWSVQHVIPLPYERAHGVVRVEDGVWVVHTSERVIVKLNLTDGTELQRLEVPESAPQPHGLARYGQNLLYCDATSGWVAEISP